MILDLTKLQAMEAMDRVKAYYDGVARAGARSKEKGVSDGGVRPENGTQLTNDATPKQHQSPSGGDSGPAGAASGPRVDATEPRVKAAGPGNAPADRMERARTIRF